MSNTEIQEISGEACNILTMLQTLFEALPDDKADARVPTRCMVLLIMKAAESLVQKF
ncbi:MAG: hypothetical protein LBE62_03455 [Azonexus sp.]|jgi:hypothetical protein|nr:hypothetical protein [Azonexus sp.]